MALSAGILEIMSSRMVSPVFAGRERELARLTAVYDHAREGTPQTVLLGGEAGGGKSRLVHEFVARAEGDPRVLVGGCVELSSAGLPYAPFTAGLRHLTRERGTAEIAGLLPSGAAADLAGLLPEFGELPPDPDAGTARARLFERMLSLMERLAEQAPIIWVIEDAHWADRSTRDLLVFLVRNLRAGPILLIITFRSDELHRTHPLRPVLAELDRVDGVTRVELPRLSRAEVAAQLEGILGHPPTPAVLDEVRERTEGIPLFVEAMIDSDGALHRSLPASLRDLLVATIQRLPEPTQEVLRVATATERAGHALLAAVTGIDEAALADTLRPAVAANVLVPAEEGGGDGYAFRHALIREAIREDLLPGEHTRVHRRFAQALEADPSLSLVDRPSVELAMHWYAAHDTERALLTAWTAAQDSAAAHAYAEQLQMLERVLELWERVADPAIDADHTGVLEMAARAARLSGDQDRGLSFVRAALAELDAGRDPERVALMLLMRARLRSDRALPGELDDLRAAERLVPEPTAARIHVLSALSTTLTLYSRYDEALPLAEETLTLARRLDEEWAEANALITLALVAGTPREALTLLETGREKAEHAGHAEVVVRALINVSDVRMDMGDSEGGAEAAREAYARARPIGRSRTQGAFAAGNLAEAQMLMGHWDEAAATLRRIDKLHPVSGLVGVLQTLNARIALARGDAPAAKRSIKKATAFFDSASPYPQESLPFAEVVIDNALAAGDVETALDTAERFTADPFPGCAKPYTWSLLSTAMRVCAFVTEKTGARSRTTGRATGHAAEGAVGPVAERPVTERAAALRARLQELADRLKAGGPASTAHRLTFLAESTRAAGRTDADAWEDAVTAWRDLGQPYPLAYTRYRAAAAILTGYRPEHADSDGRATREVTWDAAAAHLREAARLTERLDARPMHRRVRQLARRAGIALDPGAEGPNGATPKIGLTPRELEVLRLVADGHSNREIAEKLFITAKTASVHVSNIMAKMDVASRGEAAAAAHRMRLFDPVAQR
jgi:ATP/maltotriose-dependent transcriptional regulator MalT